MKFLPKSNQIRAVTVRDLMRNSAETFNLIEDGEPILLIRHGRPIATIQPLEQFVVRRALQARVEEEPPAPIPDLTDVQWIVLEGIASREDSDDTIVKIGDVSTYMLTQVELELQGLVKKTWTGWEPTVQGLEALDARLS